MDSRQGSALRAERIFQELSLPLVGFSNSLSCIRRSLTRLPLDTAAYAGLLFAVDRLAGEYSLDGSAKIVAGHRLIITWSAVVQLPAIHKMPFAIK